MTSDGCNLRDALKRARELGFQVEEVFRTGELRFSHPQFARTFRVNSRRKDASRVLTMRIRQVEKTLCKCGRPGAAPHPCPFKAEIGGDISILCNCCDKCRAECLGDT